MDNKGKIVTLFLASVSVALLNRLYVNLIVGVQPIMLFMRWYFNDIVGAIAFCAYCDLMSIIFLKKTMRYLNMILLIIVAGLFWEYITPMFRIDTTGDYNDLFAYALGANLYYLIRKALNITNNETCSCKD